MGLLASLVAGVYPERAQIAAGLALVVGCYLLLKNYAAHVHHLFNNTINEPDNVSDHEL